jgi:MscS family membrane protein
LAIRALITVVLVALTLLSSPARALAQKASAPDASAASKPIVEEAPDSPRVSVRRYQNLCARADYGEAATYLDLSGVDAKRGAELARRLDVVLRHRLLIDAETLSGLSEGRAEPKVPKGVEELGRIPDSKGRKAAVRLVHRPSQSPDDDGRWVFSRQTVMHIDDWYDEVDAQWIHARLPAVLQRTGPKSLLYWQWLAIPFLALVAALLGRAAGWAAGKIVRRLIKNLPWGGTAIDRLHSPARMAWALVFFDALLPYLYLDLRATAVMARLLSALGYLCFFWALVRTVGIFGDAISKAAWAEGRPSAASVVTLVVRLGKVATVAFAIIVALTQLGYPVTSVIAGLGIGGIALALAAQKTVENLFGSVSIVVDRPFAVGDWVQVEGIEGTVETIGLRSTRIRTLERTLMIYPNGKLADLRIEAFGTREKVRFHTMVALHKETPPEVAQRAADLAREAMLAHPKALADDVRAWVRGIGDSSIDLEVAVYVDTTSVMEFGPIRHALLLSVLRAVREAGARLAVPARELRDDGREAALLGGSTGIPEAGSGDKQA